MSADSRAPMSRMPVAPPNSAKRISCMTRSSARVGYSCTLLRQELAEAAVLLDALAQARQDSRAGRPGLSPLEELAHRVLEDGLEVAAFGARDLTQPLEQLGVGLRGELLSLGHGSA